MCRLTPEQASEELFQLQGKLSDFAQQLRYQHTVVLHLERASGGVFTVMNAPLWYSMLGAHDSLIIEMGSFFKASYSGGGVLRQVRAGNYGPIEIGKGPPDAAPDANVFESGEAHFARMNFETRRKLFAEVFPDAVAAGRKKTIPDDIDVLSKAYAIDLEPFLKERHARAHVHEGDHANVKLLDWAEKVTALSKVQRLFENLRYLLFNNQSSFNNPPHDEIDKAQGVADLILFGDMQAIQMAIFPAEGRYYRDKREVLYAQLRAEHARRGGDFQARSLWHEVSKANATQSGTSQVF